jgi:hypothetical protein
MLKPALTYFLSIVLAFSSIPGFSAEKMIEVLVFSPVPVSGQSISGRNCVESFSIWQEPSPFFEDLRKNRKNGSVRFERHGEVVLNFPEELTLHFVFSPTYPAAFCNDWVPKFDPKTTKFKVSWRNGSYLLPAKGMFVVTERQDPDIWCEDSCGRSWAYELRIDSAGVPLTDRLEITVEAENGANVAQFTGELGASDQHNGIDPTLDSNRVLPPTKMIKP